MNIINISPEIGCIISPCKQYNMGNIYILKYIQNMNNY